MIAQILNNLSIDNLPMIAYTLLLGLALMGLLLWIISQTNQKHRPDVDQIGSIYKQIDVLQNERECRDLEMQNNIISNEDHANACLEIDRRLLTLANEVERCTQSGNVVVTHRTILFSLLIPTLSTLIYLGIGSPQNPDQPIDSRNVEIAAAKAGAKKNQNEAATALQEAITATEKTPKDIETWLVLAQAAGAVNDSETEIRALRTAIEITDGDISILAMLAEALSRAADGQITVPARALIKTILKANPDEPRALFLSGLAAFQDGDNAIAIERWRVLLAISRPNAPWIALVRENIKSAAEAGDIILNSQDTITIAASDPNAEALADAATMTEGERNEMIVSMVQRLKERLADEPDDTDGWLRLSRAFDVLGQVEEAIEALANAAKSAPNSLNIQLGLLEQILSTGATTANIERAKAALTAAEKIAPQNPQTLFFKGHLARLSGDTKAARSAWQSLLDIMEPESDAAKALAAEIRKIN